MQASNIDIEAMRKKFPAKNAAGKRRRTQAIKQIAREYERKKAELGGLRAPSMKRGVVFYVVVVLGLMLLASLVMTATGKGGKARISKDAIVVRKSLDALAIALGRFHYHTGAFPSASEGLEILAAMQAVKSGWNGPYIRGGKILPDPWKNKYVYIPGEDGAAPSLFSMGPDGKAGTLDDIIANPALFDEPFRDTSWTRDWVPQRWRGIVVAPDEETKKLVETQVGAYLAATRRAADGEEARRAAFAASPVDKARMAAALAALSSRPGAVSIESHWTYGEGREGEIVEVRCATAGDEAELFVNNVSKGRKARAADDRGIVWNVEYEPGEIKVIAFAGGNYIGEAAERTAFAPAAVSLVATPALGDAEDGYALARVCDDDGTLCPPQAAQEFTFTLEGPGEIVLRDGAAIAFRRRPGSGEPLRLAVSAPGLRTAYATIPWKE